MANAMTLLKPVGVTLDQTIAGLKKGTLITTDDVWAAYGEPSNVSVGSALGAAMKRAVKNGTLTKTGSVKNSRRHRRKLPVYLVGKSDHPVLKQTPTAVNTVVNNVFVTVKDEKTFVDWLGL